MLKGLKNLKNILDSTFSTSRASGEFLLRETDFGTVHVDVSIIQRMIERVKIEGVHEIKNMVIDAPTTHSPLKIKLNLVIGQSYSAPVIGAKLRDRIREDLKNSMSIMDALFDIRVAQINQVASEKKKRRVR